MVVGAVAAVVVLVAAGGGVLAWQLSRRRGNNDPVPDEELSEMFVAVLVNKSSGQAVTAAQEIAATVATMAGGTLATADQLNAAIADGAVTPGLAWHTTASGALELAEVGDWRNVYPPEVAAGLPADLPEDMQNLYQVAVYGVRPPLPEPGVWPDPGSYILYKMEYDSTRDIYIAPNNFQYTADNLGYNLLWSVWDENSIYVETSSGAV